MEIFVIDYLPNTYGKVTPSYLRSWKTFAEASNFVYEMKDDSELLFDVCSIDIPAWTDKYVEVCNECHGVRHSYEIKNRYKLTKIVKLSRMELLFD